MRTSCGLTERCARNVPVFAAVERLRVISLVIKKEGARNVAPLSRISNGYPHSLSQASSLKQDARDDWIPEQLTLRGRMSFNAGRRSAVSSIRSAMDWRN